MSSGWVVFNDSSTWATTNTVTASSNLVYDGAYWNGSLPSTPDPMVDPSPEDPLTWLHERVGEICDFGKLD